MKRTLLLLAAILSLAAFACQPPLPPPVPGGYHRPLVAADSITWQVLMSGQFPAAWEDHMMMGWQMSNVDDRILERRDAGTLTELVVALGTNDANPSNGGWTQEDANLWSSVLLNLHSDTWLVLVKPWLTEPANPAHRAEIDEFRAFLDLLASVRPNTILVDWQPHAVQPGVLGPDGIHLAPVESGTSIPVTDVAAHARNAVILEGLDH